MTRFGRCMNILGHSFYKNNGLIPIFPFSDLSPFSIFSRSLDDRYFLLTAFIQWYLRLSINELKYHKLTSKVTLAIAILLFVWYFLCSNH